MTVIIFTMDPGREINFEDLVGLEFGGEISESDSGILTLEDVLPRSEYGDSYTEGSDLPWSPIFSDSEEEGPVFNLPDMWPVEEEEEILFIPTPVESSDDEEDDLPWMAVGVERFGVLDGIPAGAETDSEEDGFSFDSEIPTGFAPVPEPTPEYQCIETPGYVEAAADEGPSTSLEGADIPVSDFIMPAWLRSAWYFPDDMFSAGTETDPEEDETDFGLPSDLTNNTTFL